VSDRPLVGVGGVLVHQGRVLLVRRAKEPLRGRWVVPGGTVELGETLHAALEREVEEETGLRVRALDVLMVLDRIHRESGAVRHHFVIIDYLCEWLGGVPRAGSDAEAVALVAPQELGSYDLPPKVLEVVLDGFRKRGVAVPPGLQPIGPEA
jgi:ADP-ribose pyrophosphatase YjhB (NUDIX family)